MVEGQRANIWQAALARICGPADDAYLGPTMRNKLGSEPGRERPPGTGLGRRRRSQRGVAHAPTAITTPPPRAAQHAARSLVRAVEPRRATCRGSGSKSDATRRTLIGATLHEHARDGPRLAEVVTL